jgi:hypothetical protein
MKLRSLATVGAILTAIVATTAAAPVPAFQSQELPVTLVMNAQSIGNSMPGQSRMTITISRWSDETERQALLGALIELGPGAVREALQDLPEAGRVRIGQQNSYPIQYAMLTPLEDGSFRLVVATDRDIDIWEQYYRTRSLDYNIALAELRIDADMTGEGVLAAGVMLGWNPDTNTVVVEDYAQQPVRLRSVRVEQ